MSQQNGLVQFREFVRKRAIPICLTCGAVVVGSVGFLASIETLAPRISTLWSDTKGLRVKAADCRKNGYIAFDSGALDVAETNFKCAIEYFKIVADSNEPLGWYGLALIYTDERIYDLLPTNGHDENASLADKYWCQARSEGLSAASHIPPHRESDPC